MGTLPVEFALLETVREEPGDNTKLLQLLSQFKGHVKKELVATHLVPQYFEALLLIPKRYAEHPHVIVLAHSVLCYLVKRVAMQHPTSFNSELVHALLAHLIHISPTDKKKFWLPSIKAIETLYLVHPTFVESCLGRILLSDNSPANVRFTLLAINELMALHKDQAHLQVLQIFIPTFLKLLNDMSNQKHDDNDQATEELILDILKKHLNRADIDEFIQRLKLPRIREFMLRNVATMCQEENKSVIKNHTIKDFFDQDFEIEYLIRENKPSLNLSQEWSSVNGKSYANIESLRADLTNLMTPFSSVKETEQNWKLRQANIIEIRRILWGNCPRENLEAFLAICKELPFIDSISKASLSLRTTLSIAATQLIRDMCDILNENMPLFMIEPLFQNLKALLSSTKKINSQNAAYCLLVLIKSIGFHNKIFQSCFMLINEKNVFPRLCSSLLLRLFLIKYNTTTKLESNLIYMEEWVKKGITDAQTSVRESMRITFWYFYKCYPKEAKNIINTSLLPQLRKAVELAIPRHLEIDYQSTTLFNNSRRSSLAHVIPHSNTLKRGPGYARPTQASVLLGKTGTSRSTSDFTPREQARLAIKNMNTSNRKVSAPAENYSVKSHISGFENQNSFADSPLQTKGMSRDIEITEDLTTGNSNTLVKKYLHDLNDKSGISKTEGFHKSSENGVMDFETLKSNFDLLKPTSDMSTIKKAIQSFQQLILLDAIKFEEFNALLCPLRNVMVRFPEDFKPFLTIAKFNEFCPVAYLIELCCINDIKPKELYIRVKTDAANFISALLDYFDQVSSSSNEENSYYLSLYYIKYRESMLNYGFSLLQCCFVDAEARSLISKSSFSRLMKVMIDIMGNEFDFKLYYETLHKIYELQRASFISQLKALPQFTTKSKIAKELRSLDPEFPLNEVISFSDDFENSDDLLDNEDRTDKLLSNMTMVNPFNANRQTSSGSVVHNTHVLESKLGTDTDNQIDEDSSNLGAEGEKTRKLTEMTKVVSIYQKPSVNKRKFEDQDEFKDDEVSNSKLKKDEEVINLSQIFNNCTNELTVKFDTKSPEIIEAKNSAVTDSVHSVKVPVNVSNNTTQGHSNITHDITTSSDNSVLEANFSGMPLSYFELESVIEVTEVHEFQTAFGFMLESSSKIKAMSFTIENLNCLIFMLWKYRFEREFLVWIREKDGYLNYIESLSQIFRSLVNFEVLPMGIANRSILLMDLMIVLLRPMLDENRSKLLTSNLIQVWKSLVDLTGKLAHYSDGTFVMIEESRSLLASECISCDHTAITLLLALLKNSIASTSDQIQTLYLLETLNDILKFNKDVVNNVIDSEIIDAVSSFVNHPQVELRYASFNVLSEIYKISPTSITSNQNSYLITLKNLPCAKTLNH